MKCPYCNEEMEQGFVRQARIDAPLYWSTEEKMDGPFIDKKEVKLTSIRNFKCPMHYCADCRKFIVDEDELNI